MSSLLSRYPHKLLRTCRDAGYSNNLTQLSGQRRRRNYQSSMSLLLHRFSTILEHYSRNPP